MPLHCLLARAATIICVLVLPMTSTAFALTSSAGHVYEMSCNADGYVLRSKYPVSRAIGQGANTRYVSDTETVYMGKSCDAYSELLGRGTWCWANGGLVVDLERIGIGFPRQETYCADEPDLGRDCRC